MPRPKKEDGLQPFHEWLVLDRDLHATTARSYTSHLRRAVTALGDDVADAVAVDVFFGKLYASNPSTYNNVLRAWKHFVDWARHERDVELPLPRRKVASRGRLVEPLPHEVRVALRQLMGNSALTWKDVPLLQWDHVDLTALHRDSEVHVDVKVPRKNEYWRLPRQPLIVLFAHYPPDGNLCRPLIPLSPGDFDPYPAKGLKREANEYTPEEMARIVAGDELVRRGDLVLEAITSRTTGSAVGIRGVHGAPEGEVALNQSKWASSSWREGAKREGSLEDAMGFDPDLED